MADLASAVVGPVAVRQAQVAHLAVAQQVLVADLPVQADPAAVQWALRPDLPAASAPAAAVHRPQVAARNPETRG